MREETSGTEGADRLSLIGDRLARIEVLVESRLAAQGREAEETRRRHEDHREDRRREQAAARQWRELAVCVQAVAARLDKFEPVILGDLELGRKSLAERLEALERVVLSARIGWRMASLIGAAMLALLSWWASAARVPSAR